MEERKIIEGYMPFKTYKTYYRIVKAKNHVGKPLIICHGGPGSTHNTMEVLDELADYGRDVIYYDQIGCGLSSMPDENPELYAKETWCEELNALREHLNLSEVHLLGHSWGGMLIITYLSDYSPKGVKSAILSSTLPSSKLWKEEAEKLVDLLPLWAKEEIKNPTSEEKTEEANALYMHLHVGGPWNESTPKCITREKIFGTKAYNTAWGKSEYAPSGNLKDWDYVEKLKDWNYKVLITSGANDESTPRINQVMNNNIKNSKWVLFKNSRHMSYVEEHDLYIKIVNEFLKEND